MITILSEGVSEICEDALGGLPGVKDIYDAVKACQSIRDKIWLRNIRVFIESFRDGSVNDDEIEEYKKKFNGDEDAFIKETEMLMIVLNGYVDIEKCEILSNFYKALIKKELSWNEFEELRDILDQYILGDNDQLRRLAECDPPKENSELIKYQAASRLNALGMAIYLGGVKFSWRDSDEVIAIISTIGRKFYTLGIEPLNNP